MGAMKISSGPRYQKTGSPSQKKVRQIAELAEKIFAETVVFADRQAPPQKSEQNSQRENLSQ